MVNPPPPRIIPCVLQHWLTLSLTDGIGPILARRLIETAGSVEAASDSDIPLLRRVEGIGAGKASKIAQSLAKAKAQVPDEIAKAESNHVSFITPDDDVYPLLLKSIPDAPLVLYMRGTLEPRDLNAIAIVGSRKCSFYGREQAERFGSMLAGAGFTVVSGGARGVDSAAHRGAIAHTSGRTIAVLGSGIDVPYPPENAELFEQIVKRGAVLSEYPMGTPPLAENFPKRNRVVSGMSRGVLVVEADERSGALITARQAADEQNRPVMALPGRVDNPQSAGPHKLIRDGATLVTRIEHILEAIGTLDSSLPDMPLFEDREEPAPPVQKSKPSPGLSDTQQALLEHLSVDPQDVDSLVEKAGLDVSVVLRELTFLTLKGRARRVNGQSYVRTL